MSRPPEGWYPDPQDGARQRWWDGQAWTARVRADAHGAPPMGSPPPEAGRSVPPASTTGDGPSNSRRGRLWGIVAGFVAVAVIAAGGGWLASSPTAEPGLPTSEDPAADGRDSGEPGQESAATPNRDDATAEERPSDSEQQTPGRALAWRRVANDDAVFGGSGLQIMVSVTAGGPGLVAVGSDYGREGRAAAAVWTSSDSVSWDRVPHDERELGGDGEQSMSAVAVGGPGLVAVGQDDGRGAAAVWTSLDGTSWQRVPHAEEALGGDGLQAMYSVTAGGPGLVGVGVDMGLGASAVWTSSDGLAWERVDHDESVFGGAGYQAMVSVAAGGPGLVAVGSDESAGAAAVWTSTDGRSWQRVPHDDRVFGRGSDVRMQSVAAGGPGLVAVGVNHGGNAAAVWTSSDGLDWNRAPHDSLAFNEREMRSVAALDSGIIAVGINYGRDSAQVWVSEDGVNWDVARDDEGAFRGGGSPWMTSVAVWPSGLVAVGQADGEAAVWIR